MAHAQLSIQFEGGRHAFSEGDEVRGNVVVDVSEDTVVESLTLELAGVASIQWVRARPRLSVLTHPQRSARPATPGTDSTCTDTETYLNQRVHLHSGAVPALLVPAGRHCYPFIVQLPLNLPSSFHGDHGGVRYQAVASLSRPWHNPLRAASDFTVTGVLDLSSVSLEAALVSLTRGPGVLGCVSGGLAASWRLERLAYVPGERIHINGEIHNNSRVRVTRSKVALIQHVNYYDTWGRSMHERRQRAMLQRGVVLPGNVEFWRESMEVPQLVPSGLKGCRLMDVFYTLKFKVVPSGPTKALTRYVDILIGTVPYRRGAFGIQRASSRTSTTSRTSSVTSYNVSMTSITDDTQPLDLNYFG